MAGAKGVMVAAASRWLTTLPTVRSIYKHFTATVIDHNISLSLEYFNSSLYSEPLLNDPPESSPPILSGLGLVLRAAA